MASLWETLLGLGAQAGSSFLGYGAAGDSADDIIEFNEKALALSQQGIEDAKGYITDYGIPGLTDIITGYQGAIDVTQDPGKAETMALDFTGVNGPEAREAAYAEFDESAGQKWLRDQQEESLLRNAAAIGGLGGGRVRSALQEQAAGRAATNDQRYLDNISRLITPEVNRSNNIANIFSQGGENIARYRAGLGSNLANMALGGSAQQIPLLTGIGEAKSAATLGQNAAIQDGISGASGTLGALYS